MFPGVPISSGNTSGEPRRWDRVVVTTMGESLQGCLFRVFESHLFFCVFFFLKSSLSYSGGESEYLLLSSLSLSVASSHTGVNNSIVLAIRYTSRYQNNVIDYNLSEHGRTINELCLTLQVLVP